MEALIGLILGMLLGIIGCELWPRRRELLMAAALLLIWTPIVLVYGGAVAEDAEGLIQPRPSLATV
ncbi:hypothetical protein [Bradyrhizobium glycinis]|uniref:hypothetical protein n=1 Tax=Bradyrhizobium glycinis TaxID=2751812 RepID=UPI0018D73302|nr:hypothetical protein [Bradyrhizobium glycinis]MBH5372806.1 hypothetical protein [Bradyrhizobium glycinis]